MAVERPRGPRPFSPRAHDAPLEVASRNCASPALPPPPYTFRLPHSNNQGVGSGVIEQSCSRSQEKEIQERIKCNIVADNQLSDTVHLPTNRPSRPRPRPLPNPPTMTKYSKVTESTNDEGNRCTFAL